MLTVPLHLCRQSKYLNLLNKKSLIRSSEMERERGSRNDFFDVGDPFRNFRGFGGMPSLFGGRDPFDDPFFTSSFSSLLEPRRFESPRSSVGDESHEKRSKGILIEELGSDDEEQTEKDGNVEDDAKEPSVEHPDDGPNERASMTVHQRNYNDRTEPAQAQAQAQTTNFRFQTCKVTYGGIDGAYYTSTRSRRMGSDGVVIEESKEADKMTGQATHRVSRGIHDKGHSVTRKLNSDGNVDMTQTLHNLNEDELGGFEEAWKGNEREWFPGLSTQFDLHNMSGSSNSAQQSMMSNWGGWALPGVQQSQNGGGDNPTGAKTKKVVRINID